MKVAILDDWQGIAESCADWSRLRARGIGVDIFPRAPGWDVLADYEILVLTRERTAFPASAFERLPKLRLLAMTGRPPKSVDVEAAKARGIATAETTSGDLVGASTAEIAWALVLACARSLPLADANMRAGRWQEGVPLGTVLDGRTIGVVGLGRIGGRIAAVARATGMRVLAWSQNLTEAQAAEAGAERVEKARLFAEADVVSLHLVLSDRSRGIIGAAELEAMKTDAILVNTARSGLVQRGPLLAALESGRIRAGLDVFDVEPVPADDPLRRLPNVVLTPHLGFSAAPIFRMFYEQALAAVEGFLDRAA